MTWNNARTLQNGVMLWLVMRWRCLHGHLMFECPPFILGLHLYIHISVYIFKWLLHVYMWKRKIIVRTNWLGNKTQLKDSKENWKWILTPRNSFCLDWIKLYTGTVCTGTNVGSEVYYNCISVLLQDLYIYTTVLQKLEKNRYFGTVYSHGTHRSLDSSFIYLNLIFFFFSRPGWCSSQIISSLSKIFSGISWILKKIDKGTFCAHIRLYILYFGCLL